MNMDEQRIQQTNHIKQPMRVQVVNANVLKAQSKPRKSHAESGLAMLVNVIPRDEDMPGFVRGYN
jgi:hypothetical protein